MSRLPYIYIVFMYLQHYIHVCDWIFWNLVEFRGWVIHNLNKLCTQITNFCNFVSVQIYSKCAFCTKAILVNTVMALATVFCILCTCAFYWALCLLWTICIIMWPVLWHMSVMKFALSIIEKEIVFVNILKVIN